MNPMQLYAINDAQRFPSFSGEPSEEDRPSTLFYADFKVAEPFGEKAVKDTFKNCGDLTKRDWKEVAELSVVLNHLLWEAFYAKNEPLAKLYDKLWREVNGLCHSWTDEERVSYYFHLTD